MTAPERMSAVVRRWVRVYTRNLPPDAAQRRAEEIDADLHDHIAHERAAGTADRRIALGIAARMLRGVAADASWRRRKKGTAMPVPRSTLRVALVTGLILLVQLVGSLFSDNFAWSFGDYVFAAVLLGGTGMLFERAARRGAGAPYLVAAAVIALAAIALGQADDAPGLVLFGLIVMAGTLALGVRAAQRSG